jgi:hypothetical protein
MDPKMSEEMADYFRKQEGDQIKEHAERLEQMGQKLGPTGDFPEGKLTPNDEGGIQFAVGVVEGKIVLNFNSPVAWVGMMPDQALLLGQTLIKNARKLKQ